MKVPEMTNETKNNTLIDVLKLISPMIIFLLFYLFFM